MQSVRAALQVFGDHATVYDYQERQQLLAKLALVCTSSGAVEVAGEVHATLVSLQRYIENNSQLIIHRGKLTYGKLLVLHEIRQNYVFAEIPLSNEW